MKKFSYCMLFLILLLSLSGCNEQPVSKSGKMIIEENPVEIVSEERVGNRTTTIKEPNKIKNIVAIISEIEWEEGVIPSMAREEDVCIWMNSKSDSSVEEKEKYYIWFNKTGSAEIIQGSKYGQLKEEKGKELKDILLGR